VFFLRYIGEILGLQDLLFLLKLNKILSKLLNLS
jgi:hypothetical protein